MLGINDLGSFFTIQQKKFTTFCLIVTKKFFFFFRTVHQTGNDTKISFLFRINSFSYRSYRLAVNLQEVKNCFCTIVIQQYNLLVFGYLTDIPFFVN